MARIPLRVSSRRAEGRGVGLAVSIALHASAIVGAVATGALVAAPGSPPPPPDEPLAFVELLQQDSPVVGDAGAQSPAKQAEPSAQPAQPVTATPPAPDAKSGGIAPAEDTASEPAPPGREASSMTSPPQQSAPATTAPADESAAAPVRLGDVAGTGLVFGTQVVPAGPDSTVHNRPPAYPRDAARRGEQGTVELLIHIAPDGSASEVDVAASSGSVSLDRAARAAVLAWRFRPAVEDGAPVASILPFRVKFTIDGTQPGFSEAP